MKSKIHERLDLRNQIVIKATSLYCASVIAFALLLSGCASVVNPSAKVTKEQRAITDFSTIEAMNGITVLISVTDHEAIEVEASENLHAYIITEKSGDKLTIRLKDHVQVEGEGVMKVYVSAKKVEELIASGAGTLVLESPLQQPDLKLTLSGASSFKGTIESEKLSADLSGASTAEVSGVITALDLDGSGASQFGTYSLISSEAKVELSGASKAEITVNRTLNVKASGSSIVDYKGPAEVASQDLSGASSVNKL